MTDEEMLVRLCHRTGRGGVRLSFADAEAIAQRLEKLPLSRNDLRRLIDERKRQALLESGGKEAQKVAAVAEPIVRGLRGTRLGKPKVGVQPFR